MTRASLAAAFISRSSRNRRAVGRSKLTNSAKLVLGSLVEWGQLQDLARLPVRSVASAGTNRTTRGILNSAKTCRQY